MSSTKTKLPALLFASRSDVVLKAAEISIAAFPALAAAEAAVISIIRQS